MKNIWLINYYSYPPGTSSWRRHYDLGKELLKYGYNIDIIGGSFVHDRKKHILNKNEKYRIENHEGLRYHILNGISYSGSLMRILSMIEFMIKVFFYEKKLKIKPDIIYCSCPHPFNGLISLYLSKKYKCKFILEIRDLWPETWVEMGAITRKSLIYKFFAWIEKLLYKKADKIISLMPGAFMYIEKLGMPKVKVEWVSNGVDLEEFDKNYFKEPVYKFDKSKFNITYTGSIGIANALEEIFEVAKELQEENIMFNIIGDGPLKDKYINYCRENNINNVKFYSSVSKNEVPALLKESDTLIVTTKKCNLYKYGISFNKIFEYLAATKPIIIAYNTEFDLVKEANCGFSIPSENKIELLKVIKELLYLSEKKVNFFAKNGRKYAEQNFNTKNLAKRLNEIMEKKSNE